MKLLNEHDVRKVRSGKVQYGDVRQVQLSRSVTCRSCGERIQPSDDDALRFSADFTGSGSWTAVVCYMHAEPCKVVNIRGASYGV